MDCYTAHYRVSDAAYSGTCPHHLPLTYCILSLTYCILPLLFAAVQMWQMYNGSRPWAGLSHGQIIMTVVSGGRLTFPAAAPSEYVDLALSCMAFNPQDRPTIEQVMVGLSGMHACVRTMA